MMGISSQIKSIFKRIGAATGFFNDRHVVFMGGFPTFCLAFETAVAAVTMVLIWSVKLPHEEELEAEFHVIDVHHTYWHHWAPLTILGMNGYYFITYYLLPVLYNGWLYLALRIQALIWWLTAFVWIAVDAATMTMPSPRGADHVLPWSHAWTARTISAAVLSGVLIPILMFNLTLYGVHLNWHRERRLPVFARRIRSNPTYRYPGRRTCVHDIETPTSYVLVEVPVYPSRVHMVAHGRAPPSRTMRLDHRYS